MVGQNVESERLVCNVISEVYNAKNGLDNAKWDAVTTKWRTTAPGLLELWNTIDKVVVTTAKDSFQDRFMIWSTRQSEGPSMDDLITPIKNSKWDEDVARAAMAERSHDSADSDSDFVLLKCIGALCGQDQLANVLLEKAVAMFKSKAAAVCSRIATTRRQPELPPLTQDTITQYDALAREFENVSLLAVDAVSELQVQRHNWMQAPHLN